MDFETLNSQTNISSLSTAADCSQQTNFSTPNSQMFAKAPMSLEGKIKATIQESISALPFKKPIFTILRNCTPANLNNDNVSETSKVMVNYNRKEKSLGELSKKFLMMFGRIDKCVISLETVTQELGVERRRIYDIINILESLGVVFRKGKNNYQWNGLRSINQTITRIEKDSCMSDSKMSQNYDLSDDEESNSGKPSKKEKSLGLLSNGFIKLFFTWKSIISLEQAAKKLSSDNIEENKIKTKIRRLYDIANVFTALGLIKKTCLEESRKPAFQWIGLSGLERFIKRLHASQDEKEIFEEKYLLSRDSEKKQVMMTEEKPKLKKHNSLSIQSEHSAFKVRENSSPKQQVMLENLLCMLLDLCKKELQKGDAEPKLTRCQSENSEMAPGKNQLSPKSLDRSQDYVTPYIRKSVSIIQNIDYENEITPNKIKKEGLSERTILQDRTNTSENIKRNAPYKIEEFELRTIKKNGSFIENKAFEYTIKKSLEFKGKENFPEELKTNPMVN